MSPLHSPTPVAMETPGSVEEGGLTHVLPTQNNVTSVTSTTSSSELTNQIAPIQSRDSRTPPPPHGSDSLHIPPPRMLSKSAAPLRRSARLSGIGKPSASSRRLSDLVIHVRLYSVTDCLSDRSKHSFAVYRTLVQNLGSSHRRDEMWKLPERR